MNRDRDQAHHWHYAAAVELVDGIERWSVAEVYPAVDGSVWAHTAASMTPWGESVEDLQRDLEMMLDDVKRHVLDLTGPKPLLRDRES